MPRGKADSLSDHEIEARLAQIRKINQSHKASLISARKRVRLHQVLLPDIGAMESHIPVKGKEEPAEPQTDED